MADLVVTPANVFASADVQREEQIAGVAITAGQAVYLDTASGTVKLADSDGTDPQWRFRGIALNGASVNQPVFIAVADPNFTPGFTAVAGDDIWLADTAGGVTKTKADLESGDTVVHLGTMKTSAILNLRSNTGGIIP